MYVYSSPPINLSPTAEKAREILRETQETFKKQRETNWKQRYACTYVHILVLF